MNYNHNITKRHKNQLFKYTKREECLIRLACQLAEEFMEKYGLGRQPIMIDRSKYL